MSNIVKLALFANNYSTLLKRFVPALLFIQFLCQTSIAQTSLFTKISPPVFDSSRVNPNGLFIGDVNGDGFEDLVLPQIGRKPLVFYFATYPTELIATHGYGRWDFDTYHGDIRESIDGINKVPRDTVPFFHNTIGPVQIINGDNIPGNEIYIHSNNFDVAARGYIYDENQIGDTKIVTKGLPAGYGFSKNSSLAWTFSDFNKDGLLDGIQGVQTGKTAGNFYLSNVFNQNGQSYIRETESDISQNYGRNVGLYAYDFNNDNFTDLFEINAVYPGFSSIQDFYYSGSELGLQYNPLSNLGNYTNSAGLAVGDYNNDGLLDIYQLYSGSTISNRLFKNKGNHLFESIQNNLTRDKLDSRSAMWGDFNNDGYLDLVIAEYNGASNVGAYPNLFQNNGPDATGTYTFSKRIISSLPELNALGSWSHVSFVDQDLDGDLDIILTGDQSFQPILVFQNDLIGKETINQDSVRWIGFDLKPKNSFFDIAFNAKLVLTATINGKQIKQTKELQLFHGFLEQHTKLVHFGLKNATSAKLEITWPSGTKQTLNYSLNDFGTYKIVTEPEAPKMVIKSSQPFKIEANLEESKTDSIKIENIGTGTLTLNTVTINKSYYTIKRFTKTIPAKSVGYLVLELKTSNSAHIGSFTDTLKVSTNSLTNNSNVILNTKINSRPARFTKIVESIQAPFLTDIDTYSTIYSGDFNGDSFADVIVQRIDSSLAYYSYDSVNKQFLKQDDPLLSTYGQKTSMISVGDLNLDGFHDVLIVNKSEPNQVLLGSENGFTSFTIPELSASKISNYGAIVDIDNNGRLDIIIGNSSNQFNQIFLQFTQSVFISVSLTGDDFTNTLSYTSFFKVFDLDKDGDLDIITSERNNPNGNRIIYFEQTEPLVFVKTDVDGLTNAGITLKGIHVFDKDNDGDFDLLLVSALSSTASILLENNSNSFTSVYSSVFSTVKGSPGDVIVFDFNMDGFLDLFFTDEQFEKGNVLLQSTGGNGFIIINSGELVSNNGSSTLGATLFDVNLDAKPDIITANYFGTVEFYQNDLAENNWVALIPKAEFIPGKKVSIPGTKIELTLILNGNTQTLTRYMGHQSLFSNTLQAVWFGLGNATTANYSITFPGVDEIYEGTITELNTIQNLDFITVSTEQVLDLPSRFSISNAYPNPFNPSTSISVSIPKTDKIQFDVFDILGRKVFSETKSLTAGVHQISFNLSYQSSGVYFIRSIYQNKSSTQKILLMK